MRVVIGRVVAALVLLAGSGYALVLGDSPLPSSGSGSPAPVATAPLLENFPQTQPVAADREYYATHRDIVPFGRSVLQIPILMYHYIRTPPSPYRDLVGYNLSTPPSMFIAQMDWLYDHGYHTVTFNDVRMYWNHVRPLPSQPVIITLDDGYRDLYTTAFPVLQAHNFTAVAYVVTGFFGSPAYVTPDMVKEMDKYGIEIGAHTVNHADLARGALSWVNYQLVQSKRWLEGLLGHSVLDMAYPSGKYNPQTENAVANAGYYSATTEVDGVLHTQADRYVWTRVRVWGGEPLNMFITSLGPSMPSVTITSYTKMPLRLAILMQA